MLPPDCPEISPVRQAHCQLLSCPVPFQLSWFLGLFLVYSVGVLDH